MARDYCFTSWKKPVFNEDTIRYICWGVEKTKKDITHYQGFAIFKRTCRFPKAKQWIGAGDETHIEVRQGTRCEARAYCFKDGDIFEWGLFESHTKKELFEKPISYLKMEYPEFYCRYHRGLEKLHMDKGDVWRDVTVTWLWGSSGCGKTKTVMGMDNVFKCDDLQWWDGYDKETILLLDDMDVEDFNKRRFMLNLLDSYQLRLAVKGGFCWAHWKEVYITTNWSPIQFLKKDAAFGRRVTTVTKLG